MIFGTMYEIIIVIVLIIVALFDFIFGFVIDAVPRGGFQSRYSDRFKGELRKIEEAGYDVINTKYWSKRGYSNEISVSNVRMDSPQMQIIILIPHNWPQESPELNDGIRTFKEIQNYNAS